MASPIFAMSLDNRYSNNWDWNSNPYQRPSSRRGMERGYDDTTVYIRGFPGFSNVSYYNNAEATDTNQVKFDLQGLNDGADVEDLLDKLQLREDSNDTNAFAARRTNNPQSSKKASKSTNTEISTLYINMFHTQYCKIDKRLLGTTYSENFVRFFLMYMRNWEDLLKNGKRCEKQFISDFKKMQHDKLNKDEWNYLCTFVKKADFSSNANFQEFCSVLKTRSLSQCSPGSSPSIYLDSNTSTSSWLSKSIMMSNSASVEDLERNSSLEEMKRLYICIYYPNYQELWNSDAFILSGSMIKEIESFLSSHPSLPQEVLDNLKTVMTEAN